MPNDVMEKCDWCNSSHVRTELHSVFWELPDGLRAIEISETPTRICGECGMIYQANETVRAIEEQLLLVDRKEIGKTISYSNLMSMARILKKNYFDFFS